MEVIIFTQILISQNQNGCISQKKCQKDNLLLMDEETYKKNIGGVSKEVTHYCVIQDTFYA